MSTICPQCRSKPPHSGPSGGFRDVCYSATGSMNHGSWTIGSPYRSLQQQKNIQKSMIVFIAGKKLVDGPTEQPEANLCLANLRFQPWPLLEAPRYKAASC